MKGGSVSGVCKGYITKVVWRAILALMGAWGPHKLVISDNYRRISSLKPTILKIPTIFNIYEITTIAVSLKTSISIITLVRNG